MSFEARLQPQKVRRSDKAYCDSTISVAVQWSARLVHVDRQIGPNWPLEKTREHLVRQNSGENRREVNSIMLFRSLHWLVVHRTFDYSMVKRRSSTRRPGSTTNAAAIVWSWRVSRPASETRQPTSLTLAYNSNIGHVTKRT